MEIKDILLPVVTTDFEETVAFYKKITGKEVSLAASHEGYTLNMIDHFVILGAEDMSVLAIADTVNAIFLVDDLNAYWQILQEKAKKVITSVTEVSTGVRFIVEQEDGKVIEYLQLNA